MKNDEFLKHLQYSCNKKLIQGLTLDDLSLIVKSLSEVITEQVNKGETVKLLNIGQFYRVKKESRNWRNPKNGEIEKLDAKYYPRFAVSGNLKSKIEKGLNNG